MDLFSTNDANERKDEVPVTLSENFRFFALDENQRKQYVVLRVVAIARIYRQTVLQLLPPDSSEADDVYNVHDVPLFAWTLQKLRNGKTVYYITTDIERSPAPQQIFPGPEVSIADNEPIYYLNNGVKESKLFFEENVGSSGGDFILKPASHRDDSSCCTLFVEMEKPFVLK